MLRCMAGDNLLLVKIFHVREKTKSPCRIKDEHDVGAATKDMLSLIAIDRSASGPGDVILP